MTALRAGPDTAHRTVLRSEEPEPVAVETAGPVLAPARVHVARVLVTLAVLAIWLLAYLFVFSGFEQSRAQQSLYLRFRSELAAGLTPVAQPIAPGAAIAKLSVPAAGIRDAIVVEGTTSELLESGPGHLRGSVLPGQAGVSVLLGRALSYGAPFGSLGSLRSGDPLTVVTGQGTFRYRVQDSRRRGDPVPPPLASGAGRLTLVSAVGSLGVGETLYVDAQLVSKPQPAAGTAIAAGSDELPFATDASAITLTELVLALQLLVVVLVAMTWVRRRWRPVAAWVAGAPAVLAVLWLTTGIATRLLPNLV